MHAYHLLTAAEVGVASFSPTNSCWLFIVLLSLSGLDGTVFLENGSSTGTKMRGQYLSYYTLDYLLHTQGQRSFDDALLLLCL